MTPPSDQPKRRPAKEKPEWLQRAWNRVREEVGKGHQVYVVCPRIGDDVKNAKDEEGELLETDEGGKKQARPPISVMQVSEALAEILHDLRVEILHGRLPAEEKDAVMSRFAAGDIDVLIATTVIDASGSAGRKRLAAIEQAHDELDEL